LSGVNVTLENGKWRGGKLQLSAAVKMDNHPPSPAVSGNLAATVPAILISHPADLKSATIKGNTRFEVTQAGGAMEGFSGYAADFNCDMTPTDIADVHCVFKNPARVWANCA